MPETPTENLVEDVDTAIRDAYHALRSALHKVEDLKMKIIRQPDTKPFGPEHDEMYGMYLDLSKRFQATREEIRDRTGQLQPRAPTPRAPTPRAPTPREPTPPAPIPEPAPRTDEPRTVESPFPRSKSRPYVLVPVGFLVFSLQRRGDSHQLQPRRSVFDTSAPPNRSTNQPKRFVAVKTTGFLESKRKAAEPKDDSESGIGVGRYSACRTRQ